MSKTGKTVEAWNIIFDTYDILSNVDKRGCFEISANQIKEYREPRLMAKFDHKEQLPDIFLKNKLAILPITRGDYIIAPVQAYHKFEKQNAKIHTLTPPDYIESLDFHNITSETVAINCAFAAGIIEDFIGDKEMVATVAGRMGSGKFNFKIPESGSNKNREIMVRNSQIEIDAAYEGRSGLALIEAKRELADDFLVRQLYYPFRVWNKRISKPVKPVFFVYSNGIYQLYEYSFEDIENYGSITLVKQKNYAIEDVSIDVEDIRSILQNVNVKREPEIPFPQANNFERIINLCEILSDTELSRADVTERYEFAARQSSYYTDAARYLDLLEKYTIDGETQYRLSSDGARILSIKDYKKRQLEYCKAILSHEIFNKVMRRYFENEQIPIVKEIADIMEQCYVFGVGSRDTFERRASTVKGWIKWILDLTIK